MNTKKLILAMIAILSFGITCLAQSKQSISKKLIEHSYDHIDDAINYYHQLKKEHLLVYNFEDENELNKLGYQLINDNRIADAIKIFKLLVSEFPNSFNPYDSLGEAYYKNGDYELSIKNYQKSLTLNPKNKNAESTIMQINFETRDKDKFSKIYSKQDYLDDLNELAKTLTKVNPHPYKFMDKDDFWKVVDEKKNLITDTTTYAEFIWHCSQIIANINCGHSGITYYFSQEDEMLPDSLRFPMEVKLIDHKLFITDPLVNKDKLVAGQEIFSINGRSVMELMSEIFLHISTQGKIKSAKTNKFNYWTTAMIPYAMDFPKTYNIIVKGQKTPITLTNLQTYQPKSITNKHCDDNLCLTILEDKQSAILTIKTWAYFGNQLSILKKFLDESFKTIHQQNLKNLIIDVRGNGGGPSDAGIYFLQYLSKKPFTYFKESAFDEKKEPFTPHKNRFNGNTYFLIDGGGGSTTGHVLSIVKHLDLALLVGEEMGSNKFATGGQKIFSLSNTRVFYAVGRYTYITDADSVSEEIGVLPDHAISQNIEDYLNDIDTVLEYSIKLIEQ